MNKSIRDINYSELGRQKDTDTLLRPTILAEGVGFTLNREAEYNISSLDTWRRLDLLEADKPRLSWARSSAKDLILNEEGRVNAVKLFQEWANFDEFIVLVKRNLFDNSVKEAIAVKCAKRGNDVYRWRLKNRLQGLSEIINRFGDLRVLDRKNYTRVLTVTWTFDTKLCDQQEAWERIGKDFNREITRLRMKYGRISVIRTWESSSRGYPHVHALMIFHDHRFKAYVHQNSEGKTSLRIKDKGEFSKTYHSFVDVQVPYNLAQGCRYIIKYMTKVHSSSSNYACDGGVNNHDLTLALMWFMRKRAFSISGDLRNTLSDLISGRHNSKGFFDLQVDFDGSKTEKWELVGFYKGDSIGWDGKSWRFKVDLCVL